MNFVVIDLDQKLPAGQKELVKSYYTGLIPHVVVLDRFGHALYSQPGEVDEATVSKFLDKALSK